MKTLRKIFNWLREWLKGDDPLYDAILKGQSNSLYPEETIHCLGLTMCEESGELPPDYREALISNGCTIWITGRNRPPRVKIFESEGITYIGPDTP